MAKDSDVRLTHRLVVPIRDTPHAPIIFFEWAPLSGYADGIRQRHTWCLLLSDTTER